MSALRFHPHMTLQAAARIAHENGCELRVQWNGTQCVVTPVRVFDPGTGDDFVPAFMRKRAG